MQSMTWGDLILNAYRLSGVKGEGESLNGDQAQAGLYLAQEMVDEWNADNLKIFTINILQVPIVVGQQGYTVGPAGDFNVATRPAFLEGAWFQQLTSTPYNDIPIVLLSELDWGNIRAKGVPGTISTWGYYDQAYPLATLHLWPLPSSGGNLIIHAGALLDSSFVLTDSANFPPAYRKCIRFSLATLIAAENGIEPPALVASGARDARAMLEKNNGQELQRMDFDSAAMGSAGARYLISSDSFRG